jgi:hypothetical protein
MMPCRWAEAGLDFAGRVRLRRRFGYPGTIDEFERVWLTFGGCEGVGEAALNGVKLGTLGGEEGAEFEITALLRARNELLVEIEGPSSGGLWGEVALEVRRTAYLRKVRLWREGGKVQASGEVVGQWTGPLELYRVVGRRTVAYRELKVSGAAGRNDSQGTSSSQAPSASAGGIHEFVLSGEAKEEEEGDLVKVDLVGGAVVWYTVEQPLASPAPGSR